MSAIQLSFSLRTSSKVKTVHLLGNWDGYKGQLPLSKDSSKSGGWKGTFRFQGSTLKPGQRYWYYYIVDGYQVTHDPAQASTVEPTTKRTLNILDIPGGSSKPTLSRLDTSARSSRSSKRMSADIPHGRSLSPSKIISPRPLKPNAARHLEAQAAASMGRLTKQFAGTTISASGFDSDSDSDASDVPSLTSASSRSSSSSGGRSPVSPASSLSSGSCCTCERFGITRSGRRIRLDCGGSRCGYSDEGSSCGSSDSEVSESESYYQTRVATSGGSGKVNRLGVSSSKRHGVVIRGPR